MKNFKKLLFIILAIFFYFNFTIYLKIKKTYTSRASMSYDKYRQFYKDYLKCMQFQDLKLLTADNINIAAELFYKPNSKRVIILCHGYHESKESLTQLINIFSQDSLILFDFRAHGDSGGKYISWGIEEYKDILSVLKFIKTDPRLKEKYVYGIGFSMGAAALVKAASESGKFNGIVLDSCFASLETQANRMFKVATGLSQYLMGYSRFLFKSIIRRNLDLNICDLLHKINIPVLIIHSKEDKLTEVSDAYKLYECVHGPKELWIADSGMHGRIYFAYPKKYKDKVDKFFNNIEKSDYLIDE